MALMNPSVQFIIISVLLAVSVLSNIMFLFKLNQLHDLVNSRLSELLKITEIAAHAAGMEQERSNEIARHSNVEKILP